MGRPQQLYAVSILFVGLLVVLCTEVYGKPPPENGVQRQYHSNGEVRQEIRFKKGFVVRKRTFYKNGKILLDYRYRKGYPYHKRHFYNDGKLKSIWTAKSGVTKFYYANGRLRTIVHTGAANIENKPVSSIPPNH